MKTVRIDLFENKEDSLFRVVRFGDSEIKPVVAVEEVKGAHCVVVGSTSNPVNENYMTLFLTLDALRRSGASKISVVMPYMGYSRQNQQHLPGEPVSAQVVVRILEMLGMDEMVTFDLHEEQLGGFFTVPLHHLSGFPVLAKHVAAALSAQAGLVAASTQAGTSPAATNIVVVSPDQGGIERTRRFRDEIEKILKQVQDDRIIVNEQIAMLEKKRNLSGTHDVVPVEFSGASVHDAIVIIPDDVIVSGGTIVNAAIAAKEKGARAIYLCATHADFIEGTVEKLQRAPVEKVFVCDTIPVREAWKFEKLEIVSVKELIKKRYYETYC